MASYVLGLQEIDRTQVAIVGGKGANLGELARIEGIRVPPGFCVTTDAYRRFTDEAASIDDQLDRLSGVDPEDRDAVRTLAADARRTVERTAVPDDVAAAITGALARLDEGAAYAVRSSATAEDSAAASFAGQHDSFLEVVGPAAIVDHVRRCWASLFTERAVAYRLRNGVDHRTVHMAVVVQRMVFPDAAGVLFTADPVTSDRTVASIEATFGLGEALVSGRVNPDVVTVRGVEVVTREIAAKHLAVVAAPEGGTHEQAIEPDRQRQPVLSDTQAVRLAQLGRRIERHFGQPQDIEWCLVDDDLQIVQSRPITTLFPIPEAADDANHVYVSVGHQQMMTDAMKPLGLSMWQLTTRAPMRVAGGRLFVDITPALASPASRAGLVQGLGRSDPLIGDALETVLARGDFVPTLPDDAPAAAAAPPPGGAPGAIEPDPAIVAGLIAKMEARFADAQRNVRSASGPAVFDTVLADLQELQQILFDPLSHQVLWGVVEASWWLDDRLQEWLGEQQAAGALSQSVPDNVTSEMGLALLDVADAIRPHPEVVAFLRRIAAGGDEADGGGADGGGQRFLDELPGLAGGREAADAFREFLDRYGMRCVGEIDITRPRWGERPATLVPVILGNVDMFEPGEAERHFERGRDAAQQVERDVLARLRALPDGERKAQDTKAKIDVVRTFLGYREYPKYRMVSHYYVYKQALLREAERLAAAGVLDEFEDCFFLSFEELREVVRTNRADRDLIRRRRDEFRSYQALTPPRVLTSDGEAVAGSYRRDDLPPGALAGLAVSAGTVEGRARVVLDMADADLAPGDILVTTQTDPSWSPLFVSIAGLVTEVGGLMTHGAVVAREYGLPTVVGVEDATRLIADGQRIRLHGTEGYVEILP